MPCSRVSKHGDHLQLDANPWRMAPNIEMTPPSKIGYRLPTLSTMRGTNGMATTEPKEYVAAMRPNEAERG